MDVNAFLDGFAVVLEPTNLLYCLIGVVIGMLIGVLPGLGPAATIAILLPLTYGVEPGHGDHHAGRHLLRRPVRRHHHLGAAAAARRGLLAWSPSSTGYALAKQGKAGTALGIAAIGSFVGGTARHRRADLPGARRRRASPSTSARRSTPRWPCSASCSSPPSATATCSRRSSPPPSASCWPPSGRDGFTGASRFTFGSLSWPTASTSSPSPWASSASGRSCYNLEERHGKVQAPAPVANVWPSRGDLKQSSGAIGRGSVLGFFLGILPGGGAVIASLAAYAAEKKRAKDPARFGRGAIEGVAAPETANNAAATSSFIPLLTLGIPANATMAVIFGALLMPGRDARARSWSTSDPERVLGRDQLDVHRQHPAADHEHPAGRPLRPRSCGCAPAILAPITALITLLGVYTIQQLRLRHLPGDRLRDRSAT